MTSCSSQDQRDDIGSRNEDEERFRTLFRHLPNGCAYHETVLDEFGLPVDYRFLEVNPAFEEIVGLKAQEIVGRTITEVLPGIEDAGFNWISAYGQVATTGLTIDFESFFPPTRRWYLVRAFGTIPGRFASIFDDTTENRLIQDALRESEQRHRSLFQAIAGGVVVQDSSGNVTHANETACEILGLTRAQMQGRAPIDPSRRTIREDGSIFAQEDLPAAVSLRTRNIVRGVVLGICNAEGGDYRWLLVNSEPILRHATGEVRSVVTTYQDITDRKKAEAAVRQSEGRLFALLDSIPGYVCLQAQDHSIRYVNQIFRDHFGEPAGRSCHLVLHGSHEPCEYCLMPEVLETGQPRQGKWTASNGTVWQVYDYPFEDEDGSRLVLELGIDITEHERREQLLLRAQRLEAAGRLAGQVAHDFNNLLGPVAAYPALIKLQLPADHPAADLCDTMIEAGRQMAEINENMLALGRRGLLEEQPIDLNQVVLKVIANSQPLARNIDIVAELADDLPAVSGSNAQLTRALVNLVNNAVEAMDGGGRVRIRTEVIRIDGSTGRDSDIPSGHYVQLTVADTGSGIAAEHKQKIFDAFFSTKAGSKRKGAGLGLSIVQAVLEDHRGHLDFVSEAGVGTTFILRLPATQAKKVPVGQTSPVARGTETILVVDDNELQRRVVHELLTSLGYSVRSAASGEEALELIQDFQPGLLILDMVMPGGMDGEETYRRIADVRPGQRAIILSGFAESERVRSTRALGAGQFLTKPVSMETLASAVRAELDRVL